MHNTAVLVFLIGAFLCSAQDPIWSVTGGPIGIGSCYDIVTETITFPAYTWNYQTANTMYVRGNTYLLPDEVYGYSSPVFSNDSRVFIMDSFKYYYSEYVSSWGVTAGINIDGVNLDFGFNHTKGQINQMLNNSANYFAENVLTWTEFVLQLWPGEAQLHPHFLSEVKKLPAQYNYDTYRKFIKSFGTHVINKAAYGACINFTAVFKSDILNKQSMTWVSNQIKLSIGWQQFNAGINWNSFNNQTKIDNSFIVNSQNVTIVSGGQPDVLDSDGYKAWWQTVVQDYAVIFAKSSVVPIFEVIPDKTIANNLKQAVLTYGGAKSTKHQQVVLN